MRNLRVPFILIVKVRVIVNLMDQNENNLTTVSAVLLNNAKLFGKWNING
jgi:hypothetical protein